MLVRGPAKGKSLKGLLAALNLSQRTLGEAGDSRASSFRQLSSGRPSTRGQQPLPTSPLQEVLKLSTEAGELVSYLQKRCQGCEEEAMSVKAFSLMQMQKHPSKKY